jgi:hypothetical protein
LGASMINIPDINDRLVAQDAALRVRFDELLG